MKNIVVSLTLVLCFVAVSCSTDNTSTPTTDGSTLNISPATVTLEVSDSSKIAELELSCGCGFTCEVASVSGDTNVIKYMPVGNMGEKLDKHSMQFMYSPSTCGVGSYSIKLDFLAKKKTYTYTNSVVVEVK